VQDSSVEIEGIARAAIKQRFPDPPSTAGLNLALYEPPTKLDNGLKFPKQRKRLQRTFDEHWYWDTCCQFFAGDQLGDMGSRDPGELVIVFSWTLKFRFFLFGPPNKAYLGKGECTLVLDQTIEAVEDQARERVKEITRSSASVRIGRIMEPVEDHLKQSLYLGKYDCSANPDPGKVSRHRPGTSLRDTGAIDSLMIEFELEYTGLLFQSDGPSYTCLGSRLIPASPGDTVDTMINQVKKDFPELHQPSKIYELLKCDQRLLRKQSAAGIQAIVPVNDQYLSEKTSLLSFRDPLESVESGIIVIIFGALSRTSVSKRFV